MSTFVRQLLRSTEDSLVHYEKGDTRNHALLLTALKREAPKRDRLEAVLKMFRNAVPISKGQVEPYFYNLNNLVVSPEDYSFASLLKVGGESHVYMLDSKRDGFPSIVMKVNHNIANDSSSALTEQANRIRATYLLNLQRYEALPDLIPPISWLIAEDIRRNPLSRKSRKAIVCFQEFQPGVLIDVISWKVNDQKRHIIETLCSENNKLKSDLNTFSRISLDVLNDSGECVDLIGEKNLVVALSGNDDYQLLLLDPLNNITPAWGNYGDSIVFAKDNLSWLQRITGSPS